MNESTDSQSSVSEEVEVQGHIIDSLLLPKILDIILGNGGTFVLKDVQIGQNRTDPSFARINVSANSVHELEEILAQIGDHGAVPIHLRDAQISLADIPGAFPEGFYSTTNQQTEVRINGEWHPVHLQEMDCGIAIKPSGTNAVCVPMTQVETGDQIVVGYQGVRVTPLQRIDSSDGFEFMSSSVSSEKPKAATVRMIAEGMRTAKAQGEKILLVAGPALVHTGSVELVTTLIRQGFVNIIFAGNALATHDIENALFGTSLGVRLDRGTSAEKGHEHHLRAINTIRRLGGIRAAVESGQLKEGIMAECIRNNVQFILAGSIRDDGPLPEVVTDALVAQNQMREALDGVGYCLMIATTLHSIATGNLLPAWIPTACVDINPATVTKLADRGTFQSIGVVTDVEPFLRSLVIELSD